MRDAFGGVFMMRLMLAFIFIFVAFSAVSLNYAKAFRIKNQVIDVVEQMEIQSINNISTYYNEIDSIVDNARYDVACSSSIVESETITCYRGVVIEKNTERSNGDYIYYNIATYGVWNLKVLNVLLDLGGKDPNSENPIRGSWVITGEAKVRKH